MNSHPLSMLHDEIAGSVVAGFYSVPIFMAAAIPDICSALEAENGRATREGYLTWFDAWASKRMTLITANDCYSLRCGLVHQGRLGGLKGNVKQVLFLLPLGGSTKFANNLFDDTYAYAIDSFCEDMIASSNEWWSSAQENPIVTENASHILKMHPDGWGNAIAGVPLLA